ncbi:MAG: MATE family efflux transporter [Oscillospiraceae bacterium]|nr:MATE family efflux transporter [Oscillospiraceae bacterium]
MEEKEMQPRENKMGVLPINKLLVSMSVPIMLSMLVQALYNIVDSIFVSRVSENALNAVGLAFPVQNLMIAVATGTGVGINALLSRSLGEKRFDRANLTASNGVFLGVCSAIVFAVLGALFSRQFFLVQTDVAEIVEGGAAYIQVCTVCSFGLFIAISIERLLQATGNTVYSMITQMAGAVTNIIFDPIFIFVFDMGVVGAAWATVLGQVVSAALGVYFNARKNTEITLSFKGFRPNAYIIGRIYSVGVPSIIMASIGSVMTFGLNKILIGFTTTATAVFSVYFKLQSFVFMPVFGLNNGMVPIVAYNFGARKPDRMIKTVKLAAVYATGIMVLGVAVFQLLPHVLLGMFEASDYMLEIGVPALRTICLSFLLAGFGIVSSSFFQALGHGMLSLVISLVRQLIVLLPAAWLLSLSGQLSLVWWAFPIAEVFSVIFSVIFTLYAYRKEVKPLLSEDQ